MSGLPHICVCICSYQRPDLLRRSLEPLVKQDTQGLFTYSLVVADNDAARSSEAVVEEARKSSPVPIVYCVEPKQSIARARNKAVENAQGDFVAFIDDDEFPIPEWLATLFLACRNYGVDGALGPVKPHFDQAPPQWVIDGKYYDRATYPTGLVIDWRKGRTGNVLLKKEVFGTEPPFNPDFRTGEDQDFFRRSIEAGRKYVWCDEAVAYEVVPPIRWSRAFMLKRALLRGAMEPVLPTFGARDVVRSSVALAAFGVALPVALLLGQAKFMSLLYKCSYHLGVVLATAGFNPIRQEYVTQ